MKSITLFLPDFTYETLNRVANKTGIEFAHFCSNLLADFAATSSQVNVASEKSVNGRTVLRAKMSEDIKPEKTIPQIQLIKEVILFLRESGGKAEKINVEEAIFEKHKAEFSKPYYQSIVTNELRWKKNTQFARNAAREMGLIKLPSESGHGIWALTDKGWKWKFE